MQQLIRERNTKINEVKYTIFHNFHKQFDVIHSYFSHHKQVWLRFNRYLNKLQIYNTAITKNILLKAVFFISCIFVTKQNNLEGVKMYTFLLLMKYDIIWKT